MIRRVHHTLEDGKLKVFYLSCLSLILPICFNRLQFNLIQYIFLLSSIKNCDSFHVKRDFIVCGIAFL